MLIGTVLFVLGLAVVFVAAGFAVGAFGQLLIQFQTVITRVLGVVIIVLGLAFAGVISLGNADLRIQRLPAVGTGRRAGARCCLRPQLDAVHRSGSRPSSSTWA